MRNDDNGVHNVAGMGGLFGLGGELADLEIEKQRLRREALAEALRNYKGRRRGRPFQPWRLRWEPVIREVFNRQPDAKGEEIVRLIMVDDPGGGWRGIGSEYVNVSLGTVRNFVSQIRNGRSGSGRRKPVKKAGRIVVKLT